MVSYPPPFSVKASGNFRGDLGLLSTFLLSVGQPLSPIEVTVSTAEASIYTIGTGGCTTNETVIPNCVTARGGEYNNLASTSYMSAGANGSMYDGSLNYGSYFSDFFNQQTNPNGAYGTYGYDSIQFTATNGSTVSLLQQVVVNYNTTDFWTGFIGLNNGVSMFGNNNQAGVIVGMKNAGYIGSQSFSYTAGQSYTSTVGSLVLGGFDASVASFKGNPFVFSVDKTRPFLSGLLAITFSNGGTTTPLLQNSISINIDTTLEALWLPQAACNAFASAFGLFYDGATTLYFVNSTQHAANVAANPSVTFTLAESVNSNVVNNITLDYRAFDMNFTNPGTGLSTYAFPIRIASASNLYVLGNALFQNAALTVDYERQNYTIEALPSGTRGTPTLIPILSTSVASNPYPIGQGTSSSPSPSSAPTSTGTPSSGGGSSNAGAIAGGVVGGVVALALIGLLLWYLNRRRHAHRDSMPPPAYETVPTTEPKNHGAELGTQQGQQTNTIPTTYFQKPLPAAAGGAAAAAAASGMHKEHTSELPSPDAKPGSPASGISGGPSSFPFGATGGAVELPAGEHTSEMAAPEAQGGYVSRSGAVSPAFSSQSRQHHTQGSFGSGQAQGAFLEPMSPVSAMGRTSMDRQAGMSSAGPSAPPGSNMQAGGNRNSDIPGADSVGPFPGHLRG